MNRMVVILLTLMPLVLFSCSKPPEKLPNAETPASLPQEAKPLSVPSAENQAKPAAAEKSDWQPVYIGRCPNPRNWPDDMELQRQYLDFVSCLGKHGVEWVSAGSMGVSFFVRSDQLDEARRVIKAALEEDPKRWNRLTLKID